MKRKERATGYRTAALVFPNQLFLEHPCVARDRLVVLVEEPRFFRDETAGIKFHKKKLLFHRASMQAYADRLRREGYPVEYLGFASVRQPGRLCALLKEANVNEVYLADPVDHALSLELEKSCRAEELLLTVMESPGFLTPDMYVRTFFNQTRHYSMTTFYIAQRKRLKVMVRDDGGPEGGKWSFDPENRRRLPHGVVLPGFKAPPPGPYVAEARRYVEAFFPDHPGEVDGFYYPVTHEQARLWLDEFVDRRLADFGNYEDAMAHAENLLFHSLLSPLINAGLLLPGEVVGRTLEAATSRRKKIPINSLEGFIRQVIGWREFMRAVYVLRGEEERASNFWRHMRPLPRGFYDATTGILPVDTVIHRLLETGYAHHIERLMILGNFMLLCEIDPNEVYRWFMEMFIDSYDWVMVPNIYGMSQYADGGMIVTKPYISSSNYILKMSNYPRGPWCDIWDALYWRFIHKHRNFFSKNPRLRVTTSYVERMEKERLSRYIDEAERFLDGLGSSRSATDSDG